MKNITSSAQLSHIVIDGYKSIAKCDLLMGSLNVLIGANGAGKSNFISFFRLIATLLDHRLQFLVGKAGGPDALLHFGRKQSEALKGELYFGNNGYKFALEATNDNRMMFQREALWWNMNGDNSVGSGHFESLAEKHNSRIKAFTLPIMRRWRVYHFHDTSASAKVKQIHRINDNDYCGKTAPIWRLSCSGYKKIIQATTSGSCAPFAWWHPISVIFTYAPHQTT